MGNLASGSEIYAFGNSPAFIFRDGFDTTNSCGQISMQDDTHADSPYIDKAEYTTNYVTKITSTTYGTIKGFNGAVDSTEQFNDAVSSILSSTIGTSLGMNNVCKKIEIAVSMADIARSIENPLSVSSNIAGTPIHGCPSATIYDGF